MTTTTLNRPFARRLALAGGLLSLLLVMLLALSPSARAFASDLIRQIGAITVAPAEVAPSAPSMPTAEPPSTTDVSFAATSAEASSLAGFVVLQSGWLPPGYQASGDWSVAPQGQGTIVARGYRAQQGDHFLILNQYKYGSGDQFDQSYGANETVTEIQVRGQQALAISGRLMVHPEQSDGDPLPTNWLLWEENGINYTLFANALSIDELTRIAEGLSE